MCRYAHGLEASSFLSTRVWPHGFKRDADRCKTFLGCSGKLAGTPAGELGPEGWHSPCPTVLAGITHGWTSGGAENDSVVYSGCLLLSQRHNQQQDPLLSGGPWGPHQNLGFRYGPSLPALVEFMVDPIPLERLMTTHPPVDWASCDTSPVHFVHSVAAICIDRNMS